MDCEKKIFEVYRQGDEMREQFYLDEDFNVPDTKLDVREVIMSSGSVCDIKIQCQENAIRVSGKLNFQVLYMADEEETRMAALSGSIPFEEMIYPEQTVLENIFVKSAQADLTIGMIHSRKLGVKASVEIILLSDATEQVALTTDVAGDVQDIYKKCEEQTFLKLCARKKDTYRIKEEVTIDGTKESVETILWTEVTCRKLDTRLEQNQLKIQGELLVFTCYESLDGKTDWISMTVPYEGQIACEGASDQMFHQAYTSLTDVIVEPRMDEDGEFRILGVEATLQVRLVVCAQEQATLLADLYALTRTCTPKYEPIPMERLLLQNHSKCKLTEKLSLPEIKDDILQICYSNAGIQLDEVQPEEGGLRLEGILHVKFLYVRPSDRTPFAVWSGMVPFSYRMECGGESGTMCRDILCGVEELGIGLLGSGEIEVKAVLAFHSFIREKMCVNTISEVDVQPIDTEKMEQAPGMIGYIAKEGDDLWTLAKRYSTTKEHIMEVNQLESESVKCGEKLLIFKENLSIL